MLIKVKKWIPEKLRKAYNSELKDWLVSSNSSLPLKIKCFIELVRRRLLNIRITAE
tara:strand:+ start:266 stop:433 length:168 start_codon:yes stop_codon:yes gene_type:complete